AYTEETGLDPWIKSEISVCEKPEINSKLLDEITELRKENIKIKTKNTNLKQDLDEFKKELESKKNPQVLLGEKSVIEYRPPFLNELELDVFFQKYWIALEVQGAQYQLHSTSWYKDVKKLEDVIN
ncbi:1041_t:CDS:2, partial [Diversispora eburnea]